MVTGRNSSRIIRKPPREVEDAVPESILNVAILKKLDRGFNLSCDVHTKRQTHLVHDVKHETGLCTVEIDHGGPIMEPGGKG